MTINRLLSSIKRYGVRGIVDYILSIKRRTEKSSSFHKLERTPTDKPIEKGITIVGNFSSPHSLSKVLRDFAIMLRKANIPYQAYNTNTSPDIPNSEFEHLLTAKHEFSLNRYSHVIEMFNIENISLKDKRCRHWRIFFWEFESGLTENHPEFIDSKHIIAMSNFDEYVFQKTLSSEAKINKILYPFQFDIKSNLPSIEETRAKYGFENDDFIVFFNFSYASSYYRKNPEGLISAFAKAFMDNPKAKIFLKTQGGKQRETLKKKLDKHINDLGLSKRVIAYDDFLTQDELVAVTKACDVYASLHRGEGFGLGIAEAMSLGIPALVTDYSAPTEFCNSNNSCPIPYKIVKVQEDQRDLEAYKAVKEWAEPDIDTAASALKQLYLDPEYRLRLGANAQKFIKEYFSTENFKKSINDFLSSY